MIVAYSKGIKGNDYDWTGVHVGLYEYICVTFADYKDAMSSQSVAGLEADGWKKAWADMQIEGAFVVLRREVKP